MEKDAFADIKQSIADFQQSLKQHLPALENEIKSLVQSGSRDKNKIEHKLDTFPSIVQMGIGKELFVQLLEYYKTIDPEGTAFYWNEYDNNDE